MPEENLVVAWTPPPGFDAPSFIDEYFIDIPTEVFVYSEDETIFFSQIYSGIDPTLDAKVFTRGVAGFLSTRGMKGTLRSLRSHYETVL